MDCDENDRTLNETVPNAAQSKAQSTTDELQDDENGAEQSKKSAPLIESGNIQSSGKEQVEETRSARNSLNKLPAFEPLIEPSTIENESSSELNTQVALNDEVLLNILKNPSVIGNNEANKKDDPKTSDNVNVDREQETIDDISPNACANESSSQVPPPTVLDDEVLMNILKNTSGIDYTATKNKDDRIISETVDVEREQETIDDDIIMSTANCENEKSSEMPTQVVLNDGTQMEVAEITPAYTDNTITEISEEDRSSDVVEVEKEIDEDEIVLVDDLDDQHNMKEDVTIHSNKSMCVSPVPSETINVDQLLPQEIATPVQLVPNGWTTLQNFNADDPIDVDTGVDRNETNCNECFSDNEDSESNECIVTFNPISIDTTETCEPYMQLDLNSEILDNKPIKSPIKISSRHTSDKKLFQVKDKSSKSKENKIDRSYVYLNRADADNKNNWSTLKVNDSQITQKIFTRNTVRQKKSSFISKKHVSERKSALKKKAVKENNGLVKGEKSLDKIPLRNGSIKKITKSSVKIKNVLKAVQEVPLNFKVKEVSVSLVDISTNSDHIQKRKSKSPLQSDYKDKRSNHESKRSTRRSINEPIEIVDQRKKKPSDKSQLKEESNNNELKRTTRRSLNGNITEINNSSLRESIVTKTMKKKNISEEQPPKKKLDVESSKKKIVEKRNVIEQNSFDASSLVDKNEKDLIEALGLRCSVNMTKISEKHLENTENSNSDSSVNICNSHEKDKTNNDSTNDGSYLIIENSNGQKLFDSRKLQGQNNLFIKFYSSGNEIFMNKVNVFTPCNKTSHDNYVSEACTSQSLNSTVKVKNKIPEQKENPKTVDNIAVRNTRRNSAKTFSFNAEQSESIQRATRSSLPLEKTDFVSQRSSRRLSSKPERNDSISERNMRKIAPIIAARMKKRTALRFVKKDEIIELERKSIVKKFQMNNEKKFKKRNKQEIKQSFTERASLRSKKNQAKYFNCSSSQMISKTNNQIKRDQMSSVISNQPQVCLSRLNSKQIKQFTSSPFRNPVQPLLDNGHMFTDSEWSDEEDPALDDINNTNIFTPKKEITICNWF